MEPQLSNTLRAINHCSDTVFPIKRVCRETQLKTTSQYALDNMQSYHFTKIIILINSYCHDMLSLT